MAKEKARFAYEGLDRVLHEKARLGIVTALATSKAPRSFTELMGLCGLTSGNLNRHLKILENEGFVSLHKGYERNRPLTSCRLTATGRARFQSYLDVLEGIVRDAASAEPREDAAEPASVRSADA
ncbi:MAG: transcriptional regulator [Pseudomonadota bacterium]